MYGMHFKVDYERRLICYGLGIMFYNKQIVPIFLKKELDSDIKYIKHIKDEHLVATDIRSNTIEGIVILGTYSSLVILAIGIVRCINKQL